MSEETIEAAKHRFRVLLGEILRGVERIAKAAGVSVKIPPLQPDTSPTTITTPTGITAGGGGIPTWVWYAAGGGGAGVGIIVSQGGGSGTTVPTPSTTPPPSGTPPPPTGSSWNPSVFFGIFNMIWTVASSDPNCYAEPNRRGQIEVTGEATPSGSTTKIQVIIGIPSGGVIRVAGTLNQDGTFTATGSNAIFNFKADVTVNGQISSDGRTINATVTLQWTAWPPLSTCNRPDVWNMQGNKI